MTTRILVAEDDPIVRMLTARVLREGGYDVAEAEDGEAALAIALAGPPFDLMIVDQRMPGVLGDQLIERVRQQQPGQLVIRLLGNPDDAETRPVDATCVTLRKPFTPAQLLARVEDCLGGT